MAVVTRGVDTGECSRSHTWIEQGGERDMTRYRPMVFAVVVLLITVSGLPLTPVGASPNLTYASVQADGPVWVVRSLSTAELGMPAAEFLSAPNQDELVLGRRGDPLQRISITEDSLGSVDLDTSLFVPGSLVVLPNGRFVGIESGTGAVRAVAAGERVAGSTAVRANGGGSANPVGPTAATADGGLLLLEHEAILRVPPAEGASPSGLLPGEAERLALPPRSRGALAIASDPISGGTFVVASSGDELHELDHNGVLVGVRDLSAIGVADIKALTFAHTGDPTDAPDARSLYALAASPGGSAVIVELALDPLPQVNATLTASLVNTIDTSTWTPPSPDPAGIVADPDGSGLVVVDSEVNEMPLYAGANTWEVDNDGSPITRTSTTLTYTDEPTGIGVDAAGQRFFISDDDARRIYEVAPGADGNINTGDDVITSFGTEVFGSTDPEDVAFNPANGRLYIIDGLGREVYEVDEGSNGVFDGVAPAGDDIVTNFDVNQYGQLDPEGIEVNGANGNLLVSSGRAEQVLEVTRTGASMVNVFDISATNGGAAGVALAGATSGSALHLYIPDRGVDNNTDPSENDGKIYELSVPGGFGNQAPAVSAGSPATVELAAGVTLHGAVVDDGLPNPPGTVSHTWTKIGGPSGATISSPSQLNSTVSFTAVGVYTFQLSGSDGAKTTTDTVKVTVLANGTQTFVTDTRVSASSDDAEQRISQNISLTSSDLELVFDAGGNQVVGLRFASVDVPVGATIIDAYVQFVVDEITTGPTSLTIVGQAADSPSTFVNVPFNISGRSTTAASVAWSPPAWNQVGVAGPDQRTPQMKNVVQEIVGRPGWAEDNAMAFIITGSGLRTAEAYDASPVQAPLLHIEYSMSGAQLLPGGAGIVEGDTGSKVLQIPVSLSQAVGSDVSIDFATLNLAPATGFAQSGVDFQATSGTLTIPSGNLVGYVDIPVFGDTVDEPPLLWGEWLLVSFSNLPPGITLDTNVFFGVGIGIIIDDD